MMTLDQLYQRAYDEGLEIDDVHMRELAAVSFPEGWIAMDSRKYDSMVKFKCDLAHEIGHCETGSFYNIYSPFDLKEKCERKANRRAVEILMPEKELRRALREGCREAWKLADWFDVTQEFAALALKIYAEHAQTPVKATHALPPLIKASDLVPKQNTPRTPPASVLRDLAKLYRIGVLCDVRHDPLLNLPYYD